MKFTTTREGDIPAILIRCELDSIGANRIAATPCTWNDRRATPYGVGRHNSSPGVCSCLRIDARVSSFGDRDSAMPLNEIRFDRPEIDPAGEILTADRLTELGRQLAGLERAIHATNAKYGPPADIGAQLIRLCTVLGVRAVIMCDRDWNLPDKSFTRFDSTVAGDALVRRLVKRFHEPTESAAVA